MEQSGDATGALPSPNPKARLAGLLWLLVIVLGIFAEKLVRGDLIVSGNAAATATSILASEQLFRLGILADLAAAGVYIGATFLVYELMKPVNRSLSLFSALLGLAGSTVMIANLANNLEVLFYLKGGDYLASLTAEQRQALAYMAIKIYGVGYNLAMTVFAGQVLLLGWLIVKSTFLPRILGLLFVIEGVCGWIRAIGIFLLPAFPPSLNEGLLVPGLAAEGGLALWLLVMGVNVSRWREQAVRA
jgi:hypothetical protein